MTVTCPACGYENDVPGADADIACGRCETGLRASRGGRASLAPAAVEDGEAKTPSKKGSVRIAVVVGLLALKVLFIAYHLLGGHRNPAPVAVPAAMFPPPPHAALNVPVQKDMLAYELFEPEELPPAGNGLRTFAVKFNKLDPARVRPAPMLSIAVGPRAIFQPLDPNLFRGAAGPQTITFAVPAAELPPAGGILFLRLVGDPRRAPGGESNAVTLALAAGH